MSSAPHVERFKGTDWEECHEFIASIRSRALWEGKQRDSAWKADFAAPLFWHKALLWHSRLPDDVKSDWSKLEVALLERWPPPEDDNQSQIQPTPAAAPSIYRNDETNRPLEGVLKVVWDRWDKNFYVKRPASGSPCGLTEDRNAALRVRCDSLPTATLLERVDHSCHSWLAAQWAWSDSVRGTGSYQYARLTCVDSENLKSTWGFSTPFQLLTCTVVANGEVISVWKESSTSRKSI